MKKWLWRSLGILFVGLAYIGIITPGIPTTIFAILAAWAFSKSSPELNNWLHNHKLFGKSEMITGQKMILLGKYAGSIMK